MGARDRPPGDDTSSNVLHQHDVAHKELDCVRSVLRAYAYTITQPVRDYDISFVMCAFKQQTHLWLEGASCRQVAHHGIVVVHVSKRSKRCIPQCSA